MPTAARLVFVAIACSAILAAALWWVADRPPGTNRAEIHAEIERGSASNAEMESVLGDGKDANVRSPSDEGDNAVGDGRPLHVRRAIASVEQRIAPPYLELYPISQLASQLDWLKARAESGDLKATRTLYHALKSCNTAPRDEAELNARISQIFDPRGITSRLGVNPDEQVVFQRTFFQKCGVLSRAVLSERRHWLEQLAESGDSAARLEYVMAGQPGEDTRWRHDQRQLRAEYTQRARRYLDEELASGNVKALHYYGLSYRNGAAHDRDPMTAYAYYHAWSLSGQASASALDSLDVMAKQLSAEEVAAAKELGTEIYSACCG